MEPTTLSASLTQDRDLILDLGAFRELDVEVRVLKAGSGGVCQAAACGCLRRAHRLDRCSGCGSRHLTGIRGCNGKYL
jgi:hypothetical protein